jgi:uncharacterized protein YprB with RNaseH-like and TPR domain
MLEKTFVHIPGIGYTTERRLWQRGIDCWEKALDRDTPPGSFSGERWDVVRDHARCSIQSLAAGNHSWFAEQLAPKDHWRAYNNFRHRIAYIDIETNGAYYPGSITVIGVYDGGDVKSFIKGQNMAEFEDEIAKYSMLVTFNGATFDLPFLRRAFPRVSWDHLHVDLRFVLSSLGHKGGLKAIEMDLGIMRDYELRGIGGEDANYLWQEYRRGSQEALELLVKYNAADVENLETLLQMAYPRMVAKQEGAC